jgi:pantothenate kinase
LTRVIDFEELTGWLLQRPCQQRTMLAIAGAPGSGKSTLAARLVDAVNASKLGRAAVLPMDGFHYDDRILRQMGRLARKGAPDTFDVGGLYAALGRLRENAEDEIVVPVFDRGLEIARAGAQMVPRNVKLIVTEGNYLLIKTPPWSTLAPLFDATVMIECDQATLRDRLVARWRGLGLNEDEIARKVEINDLPNGSFVVEQSVAATFTYASP